MRRGWSVADVLSLRRLAEKGLSIQELATHFDRNYSSVHRKLMRLEGVKRNSHGRTWTMEEQEKFHELFMAGKTYAQISKVLGRSKDALAVRAGKYKWAQHRRAKMRITKKPSARTITPHPPSKSACYTCENLGTVWNSKTKQREECSACK